MLANFEVGPILLLVGTMLLIFIVLRRTYRHLGRRSGSKNVTARQVAAEMAAAHQAPSGLPLDRAPAEVVRWQIEMHEQAREWSARLDSKMSALAYLIQSADAQIARLEQLQGANAPVPEDTATSSREATSETEVIGADERTPAPQTEQNSAESPVAEPIDHPSQPEEKADGAGEQELYEEVPEVTLPEAGPSSEPVSQSRMPAADRLVTAEEQIKVFTTPEVEEQPRLSVHPELAAPDPLAKLKLGTPRKPQPQSQPMGKNRGTKLPEDKPAETQPASGGKPELKLFSATKEPVAEVKPAIKSGRPPGAARLSEQRDAGAGAPRLSATELDRSAAEDKSAVKRPYEQIYRLADAGYDRAAIARTLGLPLGEVSLILSLRQQQDQTPTGHL